MKEGDAFKELKRYFMVFQDTWTDFLEGIEKGEFLPTNEAELQSFLFAKCLEVMRHKKFEKPYGILAEDIFERKKADLALGWLKDGRFVAIELKYGPKIDEIRDDIKRLQEFVKSRAMFGFFAMMGNSKYGYRKKLNLKEMGIQLELGESLKATVAEEGGVKSFYQWRLVRFPSPQPPFETLLVGIMRK